MAVTLEFSNPTATVLDAYIFDDQNRVYDRVEEEYVTPDDGDVADYAFETESAGYGDKYRVKDLPVFAAGLFYVEVRERVSSLPSLSGNQRFGGDFQVDENGDEVLVGTVQGVTLSAAQVAAILEGTTLQVQRGDSLAAAFTGLGSISARDKLWLTVKKRPATDTDAQSLIQIEETAGLVYLNGAAATANQGAITVTNPTTGALTISLAAVATAQLPYGSYTYDLQMLVGTTVSTLTTGVFRVMADVTRATG